MSPSQSGRASSPRLTSPIDAPGLGAEPFTRRERTPPQVLHFEEKRVKSDAGGGASRILFYNGWGEQNDDGAMTAAPTCLPGGWGDYVADALDDLEARHLMRRTQIRDDEGSCGTSFGGNDYLGLARNLRVRRAAAAAALDHGGGPRGSLLVCGYSRWHARLEATIARMRDDGGAGREALLFPSGYAANVGTIAALASDADAAIFSDALNHASIVDGARLARRAGAAVHVYPHLDIARLDELLSESRAARKLVVTESLFGMDGDVADLAALVALRERHGFLLIVDEAHATLLLGCRGGGLAQALGPAVSACVDVSVGTLSKAVGAHGGFVVCGPTVRALLANRSRPLIYSTALPLPVVAAAQAALEVSRSGEGDALRAKLSRNVARLVAGLSALGVRMPPARCEASPVVPVRMPSETAALAASAALARDRGMYVPAIRPPTVPRGTSRLRVSVSAYHAPEDIDALIAGLGAFLLTLGGQTNARL